MSPYKIIGLLGPWGQTSPLGESRLSCGGNRWPNFQPPKKKVPVGTGDEDTGGEAQARIRRSSFSPFQDQGEWVKVPGFFQWV